MPEGPEIRRSVDTIAAAIAGNVAERVTFGLERLRSFEHVLSGRAIEAVTARGKAVLVWFAATDDDDGWCVYSHNQLYGKWLTGRADRVPSTKRQLRFAVLGARQAARLYSASDIRIVRPDEVETIDYIARLGPDPVNERVSAETLAPRLDDRRFAGRALGHLLLSQAFIAGIGNYLRTEILHRARLHPARRPCDLEADERERLITAILALPEQAYRLAGVTNDAERETRMKADGASFRARRHLAFTRDGQPCYRCDAIITRAQFGGRRVYLCPSCQPAPATR